MQFGHKIKVHSVQTAYECRRKEDDVDDGEDLDDTVLFDINETEECILEVVQTVKTEPRIIKQRVDIFDNHRQTRKSHFRKLDITRCLSIIF